MENVLVGAWSLTEEPRCVYHFQSDRTFVVRMNNTVIVEGEWDTHGDFLSLVGTAVIEHYTDGFGYRPIDTGEQLLQMYWESPELLTLYDRGFLALRKTA